jgi:hypothetical protein
MVKVKVKFALEQATKAHSEWWRCQYWSPYVAADVT